MNTVKKIEMKERTKNIMNNLMKKKKFIGKHTDESYTF